MSQGTTRVKNDCRSNGMRLRIGKFELQQEKHAVKEKCPK